MAVKPRTTSASFDDHPHSQVALDYAVDVVQKKIPANKYTRLACQRHLDDLARKRFKYTFDPEKADRVCRFIEKMPHVKGVWAAKNKRLVLEAWQIFFVCCLFGWVDKKTKRRRFRKAYLKVPRKNGKTLLAAAIAVYMLTADGEYSPEVYLGAQSERDAQRLLYKPVKTMCDKLPQLRNKYGLEVWRKHIDRNDGGKLETVIGKPGDGANPSLGLVDEYHEHASDEQVDTFTTGMASREQGLVIITTTAGFDLGGPCFAMELDLQKQLEQKSLRDETTFSLMYGIDAGDDPYSIQALKKANPNYGVSVFEDFLLAAAAQAKKSPRKQAAFLTKHCNEWVGAKVGWLKMAKWIAAEDPELSIEQFANESSIYSIDLASRLDFCAGIRLFAREIGGKTHYYFFPHFWLSTERIETEETRRYVGWFAEGLIDAVEGPEVEYSYVQEVLESQFSVNNPTELAYDPFHATMLAQLLDAEGVPVVEFGANARNFSEPMREFEAALESGRVHFPADPILRWMASNATARQGANDKLQLGKQTAEAKIDGIVAMVMAFARQLANEGGHGIDAYLRSLNPDQPEES